MHGKNKDIEIILQHQVGHLNRTNVIGIAQAAFSAFKDFVVYHKQPPTNILSQL